MLHIDVVSDEELIHYLTPRKGKLEDDTQLITITEPDSQIIIPTKKGVYSDQFTAESLKIDYARSLIRFIEELLDLVQTEWDKDHKLIIHSFGRKFIARDIANFLFWLFPDKDINSLYYNTFTLDEKHELENNNSSAVFEKLLKTYEFFKAYKLDI